MSSTDSESDGSEYSPLPRSAAKRSVNESKSTDQKTESKESSAKKRKVQKRAPRFSKEMNEFLVEAVVQHKYHERGPKQGKMSKIVAQMKKKGAYIPDTAKKAERRISNRAHAIQAEVWSLRKQWLEESDSTTKAATLTDHILDYAKKHKCMYVYNMFQDMDKYDLPSAKDMITTKKKVDDGSAKTSKRAKTNEIRLKSAQGIVASAGIAPQRPGPVKKPPANPQSASERADVSMFQFFQQSAAVETGETLGELENIWLQVNDTEELSAGEKDAINALLIKTDLSAAELSRIKNICFGVDSTNMTPAMKKQVIRKVQMSFRMGVFVSTLFLPDLGQTE